MATKKPGTQIKTTGKPSYHVETPPYLHYGSPAEHPGINLSTAPVRPSTPSIGPASPYAAAGQAAADAAAHKTTAPFNTPDEQLEWSDRWAAHTGKLFDIDSALNTLRTDTDFQKANIDTQLAGNISTTVDNMIGRGLGQSSIKDGELNDLNATAMRRKSYLDTTLANADLAANGPGGQKAIENGAWDAFINWYNQHAVANAQAVPVAPPPQAPGSPSNPGTPTGYSGPKGYVNGKYVDAQGGVHAVDIKGSKKYYLNSGGGWTPF